MEEHSVPLPKMKDIFYAQRRIDDGATPEVVRIELVSRGLTPEQANCLVKGISPPSKWRSGWRRQILIIVGGLILLCAGLLYFGNTVGFFPTFSGAGTIALIVGSAILALATFGKRKRRTNGSS